MSRWDEELQQRYGELVVAYFSSGFADRTSLSFANLSLYEGVFDALCATVQPWIDVDAYTARHVINSVFCWLGVVCTGWAPRLARGDVEIAPGTHSVYVQATLSGDRWQLSPRRNGADLWSHSIATLRPASGLDRVVRPWGSWVVPALVATVGLGWIVSFLAFVGDRWVLAWTIGASARLGVLAGTRHLSVARWAAAGLLGAAFVPVPTRLRNLAISGFPKEHKYPISLYFTG